MNINITGTPNADSSSSSYETFQDFVTDTSKQGTTGYLASLNTGVATRTIDLYDKNGDGIIDSFDGLDTSGPSPVSFSGTVTFDKYGIFHAIQTTPTTIDKGTYGRLAYDANGKEVGLYTLENLNPTTTLIPDTNTTDTIVATATDVITSSVWTLLDNDGNGTVDHAKMVDTGYTQNYSITWNDGTHFTARAIFDLTCATFDASGHPTSFTVDSSGTSVTNTFSITWLAAKATDNSLANFTDTATGTGTGKFYDTNSDGIPDKVSFINAYPDGSGGIIKDTETANISGWSSLSATHPSAQIEVQASTWQGEIFTGSITGTQTNPTSVSIPSYYMAGSGTQSVGADPYAAAADTGGGTSTTTILAGVGGVGLLAWLLL